MEAYTDAANIGASKENVFARCIRHLVLTEVRGR